MYSFMVYLPVQILHIRVGHLSYSSYVCCTRISPEMSSNFVSFRFYSAEISCALNFLHERGEEKSIAKYLPGQIEIIVHSHGFPRAQITNEKRLFSLSELCFIIN